MSLQENMYENSQKKISIVLKMNNFKINVALFWFKNDEMLEIDDLKKKLINNHNFANFKQKKATIISDLFISITIEKFWTSLRRV